MTVPEVKNGTAAQIDPEIYKLLRIVIKLDASDLHLKVGAPPMIRLNSALRPLDAPRLTDRMVEGLIFPIMTEAQKAEYARTGTADLAHGIRGEGRFRINVFRQRGSTSVAIRKVHTKIPDFASLHLPPIMSRISDNEQGLVILAGITGSGKSTTIAAMLEHINQRRACHIITIEDPIEYLFQDKKSFINQREISVDVADWTEAMRRVVREDPDVILVGEMRDTATFEAGLQAAETGHLVFGTLHSSTAASTLTRILDLFPTDKHELIRNSLAFNLKAIICQKLLPSIKPGVGRVPAVEILLVTPIVRKLILEKRDQDLGDAVRIGHEDGMQDFTESLRQLVVGEWIEPRVAFEVAPNEERLKMALKGIRVGDSVILGD
jgi:twitching motility protein PilT